MFIGSLIYIGAALLAYFISSYQLNVVTLILSTIVDVIFFNHCQYAIVGGVSCIYILITFVKLKLNEVIKSMLVNVRWGNKVKLYKDMVEYNKLTKIVVDLNGPINAIIGVIYVVIPYVASLLVERIRFVPDTMVDLILNMVSFIIACVGALNVFMVNFLAASVPDRNRTIAKHLYKVFCDNNFDHGQNYARIDSIFKSNLKNTKLMLKVDSFIDRLNNQYLGFHAFNMIKFTKLSFYQFIMAFVSSYILVRNLSG